MNKAQPIAAGFHFVPLSNGNVQMEFFDEDDQPVGSQIITPDVLDSLPLVVALTQFAISKGKTSSEFINELNDLMRGA